MNKKLEFREAFLWEKEVEEFIKDEINGYSLNVPCGKSTLGDVRLDINPNLTQKEIYDMFKQKLPYADNTFDTVISDPPWSISLFKRPKLFFELVRVTKLGGKIIYNALWIPRSNCTKLEKTLIRQSNQFTNVSIISIFIKIAPTPEETIQTPAPTLP
jgi:hypothetical protein